MHRRPLVKVVETPALLIAVSWLLATPVAAQDASSAETEAPPPPDDEPSAAELAEAPVPGAESGRADPPARDSLLRDIGQGVLLPPRVAFEVAMAPVRASIYVVDRYRVIDWWKRIFFDPTYTYGLYPTAVLDSSYGLTVGARFVHRDLFGKHEHLALRAGTGGEYRAVLTGGLRTGERLGEHVHLEVGGEYERRPDDSFYGFGNLGDAIESNYRQRIVRGVAIVDVRAGGALHVRGSGALTDLAFDVSDEGPPIDVMYDPSVLTGWRGTRNVYGELELRWDQRRYPTALDRHQIYDHGWLGAVYGGRVHQLTAGDDYWRYGGDLQWFLRLGAGPRVLVTRLHADAVTGQLDDVAFTQLPELGGKYLLRGYPRDRFRDRIATLASVEYQWDLGRYLMASVFSDAGRVSNTWRGLDGSGLRVGYGVGLQVHAANAFIAEVSIASSIDGGVFVDLAFDPVFDLEPRVEQK